VPSRDDRRAPCARSWLVPHLPRAAAPALCHAGMHDLPFPGDAGVLSRASPQGGRVKHILALLVLFASPLTGQGYRLRLDGRFQAVGYRGVQLDSIAVTDTVVGSGGGPTTPDGFAVRCPSGAPTACSSGRARFSAARPSSP